MGDLFTNGQFDQNALIQSMLNPLGSLNLSATETKLLFFRHLGAEYAQSAKRGRVPYASQLVKAGTAFGGLAGGADPMMMMLMMNMMGQQGQQPVEPVTNDSIAATIAAAVNPIFDRLDAVEAKTAGL